MANRLSPADEVRGSLDAVFDPELDEPITSLGFVDQIEADAEGSVRIRLRLPTYWCAANFAFMIAADARDRVAQICWVNKIDVELLDHYCGAEISRGVSGGRSFAASFAGEPAGDLGDLRAIFRAKSFMRRQERLIRYLLGRGNTPAGLVRMTIGELEAMPITDDDGARLRARYLEARRARRDMATDDALALVRSGGRALTAEELPQYLSDLRIVRVNMEFNGEFCRGLLRARKENPAFSAR
jgi:metal-sulfur cluster biosynthetic enzyme